LAGDMAQIIIVLELPPREFCRILVRHEERYGTTSFFLRPIDFSARISITSPKWCKDLLILPASFNLSELTKPVLATL
jgi:hypothetical protein